MRCVIIGGADINNYEIILNSFEKDDFYIFCDSGLKHQKKLNIKPDLIVGDFDSYEKPETDTETIVLPCEKDDTDTVFAVKEALKRGFDDFLIIGVIGGRLDHTIGNISILNMLCSEGKNGIIIDDYSEIEIVSERTVFVNDSYSFFSLLNVFGETNGIYIKNAKYPLENAEITSEYQYGISNEVLPDKIAEIKVTKGRLLLIKTR